MLMYCEHHEPPKAFDLPYAPALRAVLELLRHMPSDGASVPDKKDVAAIGPQQKAALRHRVWPPLCMGSADLSDPWCGKPATHVARYADGSEWFFCSVEHAHGCALITPIREWFAALESDEEHEQRIADKWASWQARQRFEREAEAERAIGPQQNVPQDGNALPTDQRTEAYRRGRADAANGVEHACQTGVDFDYAEGYADELELRRRDA